MNNFYMAQVTVAKTGMAKHRRSPEHIAKALKWIGLFNRAEQEEAVFAILKTGKAVRTFADGSFMKVELVPE